LFSGPLNKALRVVLYQGTALVVPRTRQKTWALPAPDQLTELNLLTPQNPYRIHRERSSGRDRAPGCRHCQQQHRHREIRPPQQLADPGKGDKGFQRSNARDYPRSSTAALANSGAIRRPREVTGARSRRYSRADKRVSFADRNFEPHYPYRQLIPAGSWLLGGSRQVEHVLGSPTS